MNTPRIARFVVLMTAAVALVWIAGCGGAEPSQTVESETPSVSLAEQLEQRRAAHKAQQAAESQAAAAAEREALANEPPTVVVREDFKRGKKLEGGGYLTKTLQTGIVVEQQFGMLMMKKALGEFNAEHGRYPESHEEFLAKIIQPYGIELEELDGPYDYQYNPEDHQLYKVPSLEKFDAGVRRSGDGSGDK